MRPLKILCSDDRVYSIRYCIKNNKVPVGNQTIVFFSYVVQILLLLLLISNKRTYAVNNDSPLHL